MSKIIHFINFTVGLLVGGFLAYLWFDRSKHANDSVLVMAETILIKNMIDNNDLFSIEYHFTKKARAAIRVYDKATTSFLGKLVTPRATGFRKDTESFYLESARDIIDNKKSNTPK